jgi:hypothetical protein
MKVKIKDQVFDSRNEPILVLLERDEKELIANMAPDDKRFCVFPDDWNEEDVLKFMEI